MPGIVFTQQYITISVDREGKYCWAWIAQTTTEAIFDDFFISGSWKFCFTSIAHQVAGGEIRQASSAMADNTFWQYNYVIVLPDSQVWDRKICRRCCCLHFHYLIYHIMKRVGIKGITWFGYWHGLVKRLLNSS